MADNRPGWSDIENDEFTAASALPRLVDDNRPGWSDIENDEFTAASALPRLVADNRRAADADAVRLENANAPHRPAPMTDDQAQPPPSQNTPTRPAAVVCSARAEARRARRAVRGGKHRAAHGRSLAGPARRARRAGGEGKGAGRANAVLHGCAGLARRVGWVLPAVVGLAVLIGAVGNCGSDAFVVDARLGGAATRSEVSRNAFGLPVPQLTNEQRRTFEVGDSFFTQNWVTSPASTAARDGLGPTFNAPACSTCHTLDGRGAPPDPLSPPKTAGTQTAGARAAQGQRAGLLVRLSLPGADPITGAPLPDPVYGGQLQDRSVLGVAPEGMLAVRYETVTGAYGDGTVYELRMPSYEITDLRFGPLAQDVRLGPRLAPQVIGMGLLQAIEDESILALADPDDADGDGISGRANMVWDHKASAPALGRFGWKANTATVEQQTAAAFHGDIGVTSPLHPDQNCPKPQTQCASAPGGGEPELTASRLAAVEFYVRTLAVPAARGTDNPDVVAGARLFEQFDCSSCHTTAHRTGPSDVAALSEQEIHPYTDLLLHDMGPGLADGRGDFDASGSEWRTPPLWGIGLVDEINGHRFLLHDGRARTPEEAILWHGGEASSSQRAFRLASAEERAQILAFLEAI